MSASLRRITGMVLATAMVGLFVTYRMYRAGQWLPSLPWQTGIWNAVDDPLTPETLKILGNPKAEGRIYYNLFGEQVSVSAIAADSFDAYHEPTICATGLGFTLSASRRIPIDGPGTDVRAMVFRNGRQRILMYYWQQNRAGGTDTEKHMGNYSDLLARMRTATGTVLKGDQNVLIRVLAPVPPGDPEAVQTRRNVAEVALAVYRACREDG